MRYLHKERGVGVQAMQVGLDNGEEVAAWCGGLLVSERNEATGKNYPGVNVPHPSGNQRASIHWYVVRDARGRFEAVHPYTFVDEYEPVKELDEYETKHSDMTGREALGFTSPDERKIGFSD